MRAAQARNVACVSVIFSLAFSGYGAVAEPLRLTIASASAGIVQTSGEAVVEIRLTDDSSRLFTKFTVTNVGQAIDIRIDGKSVFKPVVHEPIMGGGSFQIQIPVGEAEQAQRLAARLSNQTAALEVEAVSK
jgi:preprotein translocase subunit SecD